MHRTVKDFLHSTDRTGPLQFSEEVAINEVDRATKTYLQVTFPKEHPTYGPQIMDWDRQNWQENLSTLVNYLEDRKLLRFSLYVQSMRHPSHSLSRGHLSKLTTFVLRNDQKEPNQYPFTFPVAVRKLYPAINTRLRDNDPLLDVHAITIGECFRYACSHGLVVATTNLLELLETPTLEAQYAILNGCLLAAIENNLLTEVRALTLSNRHQSMFLGVNHGWPIGRYADRRTLDSFIQLAVRSGSFEIVDYLFAQTHSFYARAGAVLEFSVTQTFSDSSTSSVQALDTADVSSDSSSIRSFNSEVLGLVQETNEIVRVNRPWGTHDFYSQSTEDHDSFQIHASIPRSHETDYMDFQEAAYEAQQEISYRDRNQERQHEQREFTKLYETCIHRARIIGDAAISNSTNQTGDIRESLLLVMKRHVSLFQLYQVLRSSDKRIEIPGQVDTSLLDLRRLECRWLLP
jgi:hypothetical protein